MRSYSSHKTNLFTASYVPSGTYSAGTFSYVPSGTYSAGTSTEVHAAQRADITTTKTTIIIIIIIIIMPET